MSTLALITQLIVFVGILNGNPNNGIPRLPGSTVYVSKNDTHANPDVDPIDDRSVPVSGSFTYNGVERTVIVPVLPSDKQQPSPVAPLSRIVKVVRQRMDRNTGTDASGESVETIGRGRFGDEVWLDV